ncbi:hypothetical protein [Chromohalobacter israelensis]|uniref:hypothetical protein n=1 Tax=Chromohalobacter israelensis TaxID=141390 RepID=UPI000D719B06|nr:hypothetical protein [Chromohalobacter salexigens]
MNTDLTARVKLTLERFPRYGYRRLACVLGENRKPIQRILQLKLAGAQATAGLPTSRQTLAVDHLTAR